MKIIPNKSRRPWKTFKNFIWPKAIEKAPTWLHKNPIKPVSTSFQPPLRLPRGESSLSGDLNTQTIYGSGLLLPNIAQQPLGTSSPTWNQVHRMLSPWNPTSFTPYVASLSQPSLNDLETFEMLHDSKQFTSYLKQLAEKA